MPTRPTRAVSQQHRFGVAQVLQCVELQHHVEALVLEQREALLQIELDHVDAALFARQHVGVCNLDAVARAAPACRAVAPAVRRCRSPDRARASRAAPARRSAPCRVVRSCLPRACCAGRSSPWERLGSSSAASLSCTLRRDVVEACAQHAVVTRVVEQERVVPVRRVDLGIADIEAVVEQRLDDLARARRREAPVGGEADELELRARAREARASDRRRNRAPGRSSRARA